MKKELPLGRMSLQASYLQHLADVTDDDKKRFHLENQVRMIRMMMNRVDPNYQK